MKQCSKCQKEYSGRGEVCNTCRSKKSRMQHKEEIVATQSVEETFCHGCNTKVEAIVCICHLCIAKGVTHKSLGLDIAVCTPEPVSNFGEPNWKKHFKTKDEAKASLLNTLAAYKGTMGRFMAFGYDLPAKLIETPTSKGKTA